MIDLTTAKLFLQSYRSKSLEFQFLQIDELKCPSFKKHSPISNLLKSHFSKLKYGASFKGQVRSGQVRSGYNVKISKKNQ
jgi:hypothetical protein